MARIGYPTVICALSLLLYCPNFPSVLVSAADPDILSDFVVPAGVDPSSLDGSFFTSTLLRQVRNVLNTSTAAAAATVRVSAVNSKLFPALEGLGISFGVIRYPPQSLHPPHLHPRASELLYVVRGVLDVGLVDSSEKVFSRTLQPGDLFVFPKGLIHYQINFDLKETVEAVTTFGSSNPGYIRPRPTS